MLELVQRAHAKQSRNNGRIPYWMHVLSVAQIVERALDVSGEVTDDLLVEYARTATLLRELIEYNYERLCRNVEMYRLADELARVKPTRQPNSGAPAPREISEEAWQRALARTRERERKEGERFKGAVFFVPTKDD